MTHIKQFAVADPRTFDGDVYEVADRAVAQAQAVVLLAQETVDDGRIMARNAELERQEAPDAVGWDETAEGRRWRRVQQLLKEAHNHLSVLRKSASYNPKKR